MADGIRKVGAEGERFQRIIIVKIIDHRIHIIQIKVYSIQWTIIADRCIGKGLLLCLDQHTTTEPGDARRPTSGNAAGNPVSSVYRISTSFIS